VETTDGIISPLSYDLLAVRGGIAALLHS